MAVVKLNAVTFKRLGSSIVFDATGIRVTPLLFAPYEIPWSNIEFINPIPTYAKAEDGWDLDPKTKNDASVSLAARHRLNLQVVVSDFHDIPIHAGQHKMVDGNNKPTGKGFFDLRIRTNKIDGSLSDLFDLLVTHTKFDLLVRASD